MKITIATYWNKNDRMNANQKNLGPLFLALAVLAATTVLLLFDKRPKYDEYDRLMW
jgi:hypothetical protein